MPEPARAPDVSFAELLERLIRLDDAGEAGTLLLEHVGPMVGGPAVLLLASELGPRGATWGFAHERSLPLLRELAARESPLVAALARLREPALLAAGSLPPLVLAGFALFPLRT